MNVKLRIIMINALCAILQIIVRKNLMIIHLENVSVRIATTMMVKINFVCWNVNNFGLILIFFNYYIFFTVLFALIIILMIKLFVLNVKII